MKHKYIIIFILLLLGISHQLLCQDPFFSQSDNNRLYLNPAFAGFDEYANISLNYRNQWPDIESNFSSYSASYDQYISFLHGGVGGYIINDAQGKGIINNMSANLIYSYVIKLNRYMFINAGLQGSYGMRTLSASKLSFIDETNYWLIDGSQAGYSNKNNGFADFAAGAVFDFWDYKHAISYIIGFSSHHLTEPKINNVTKIPRKYTGHVSMAFPFIFNRFGFEQIKLNPSAIYTMQHNFNLLNYGADLIFDYYSLGFHMKHNLDFDLTTFILSAGFTQPNYRLFYSYDFITPKKNLVLSKFGGHEVTFLLNLEYKNSSKTIKYKKH